MDAFESLEQDLLRDGITVFRDKLPKCIGYYTNLYDFTYLNVDRDLRGSKAFTVLCHETGHHRTGLAGDAGKNEYRADKWAAGVLVHPFHIICALRKGCRNLYELSADRYMDEQYIKRCFGILSEVYGGRYEHGDYLLTFDPLMVLDRRTGQVWPETGS